MSDRGPVTADGALARVADSTHTMCSYDWIENLLGLLCTAWIWVSLRRLRHGYRRHSASWVGSCASISA